MVKEGRWGNKDKCRFSKVVDVEEGDIVARDILHPSKHQHEAIASRFIEVMNKRDRYIEPFYNRWKGHYNPIGAELL